MQSTILGFDPGRDKCGLAVMGEDLQLYYHQTVPAQSAIANIQSLLQKLPISVIVMGDRTTAKQWRSQLESTCNSLPIVMVDEHNSTLEARDRYWQMYPPKGLAKLVPQGLREPPAPIDDIVAILLIERYLKITVTSDQ
ncbi:Holliday junction resolvase RuvX [Aliterella atlantica]|uniref:Resolvase n=1 Tax=Aliterella atlantica CENA595 TaxID=1618023 RepID=A0A0D8ZMR5_9CYAN|nr:Holliday junction resolvase RuvX [Aliterella atlantica]KJH69729.1 resolvase [Aliterella atlantica CENA595]